MTAYVLTETAEDDLGEILRFIAERMESRGLFMCWSTSRMLSIGSPTLRVSVTTDVSSQVQSFGGGQYFVS